MVLPQSLYRSIFSGSTRGEREQNFKSYWAFTLDRDGEILESEKDLVRRKKRLADLQESAVRSRQPLADPDRFYRNYVTTLDDPRTFDRKTLLLTFLYKFARHEWVGISAAWDAVPEVHQAALLTDKISRYHLCEEFCHVRLFHEMFRTMRLDRVEWVPLGKWMQRFYGIFPHLPESWMSPPAFVSELMGLTFYLQIDRLLEEVLADEPEARARIRVLLHEITTDELAHVGQRRNYMGPLGVWLSQRMVEPMIRMFCHDIPEASLLFDVDRLVEDAKAFNYGTVSPEIIRRSWVPSYCMPLGA